MSNILIADDNPKMLSYLCEVVQDFGEEIEPTAVSSEHDAIQAINSARDEGRRFDAAIIDLFLTDRWAPNHPEKGEGWKILRMLRETFPQCLRILISAKRNDSNLTGDLAEIFVSFHEANLDPRTQLEDALRRIPQPFSV